jgi:hypothetical protein
MELLVLRGAWHGALDLGKWRFAFQFGVADSEGNFLLVDEYFSQNEDVTVRALAMHKLLKSWKVREIAIPADCADPKGIDDLNEALDLLDSPYRVYAIDGALKKVQAGISRVENMLNRGALKVRRGMGADHAWYLRRGASGIGLPVMGSRWMWEIVNWMYPKAPDGKVQKDEPDDASADGADMMDGIRYLIMQFFPADAAKPEKKHPTRAERLAKEMEDIDARDPENDDHDDDPYGGVLRQ